MKLRLALVALLGLIAYLLLHPSDAEKKPAEPKTAGETATPPPASSEAPAQPALAVPRPGAPGRPMLKPPIEVPSSSLMVVRGSVASITPDGMFIECGRRNMVVGTSLDAPKIKKQAVEDDMNNWGPLLVAQDDNVHRMDWEPAAKATGRLFLKDHPFQFQSRVGDHVNVVAVPLPQTQAAGADQAPVYTMRFALEAGSAVQGDKWMWQKKKQGSSLDRPNP